MSPFISYIYCVQNVDFCNQSRFPFRNLLYAKCEFLLARVIQDFSFSAKQNRFPLMQFNFQKDRLYFLSCYYALHFCKQNIFPFLSNKSRIGVLILISGLPRSFLIRSCFIALFHLHQRESDWEEEGVCYTYNVDPS